MKANIFGLLAFFFIATGNCELRFITEKDGGYIYQYNGRSYRLPQSFHNLFYSNPEAAEQKIRSGIRISDRSSSEGDDGGRSRQEPTRNELNNAQSQNTFKPNRQSSSNIHFPPSGADSPFASAPSFGQPQNSPSFGQSQNSPGFGQSQSQSPDFLPPPSTDYNRPIPEDREKEDSFRGTGPVIDFAWNLFKSSNSQDNFVISPLSPQILLSYLAWVADGQTRNELTNGNGYGSPKQINRIVSSMLADSKGRELDIATAFFVSKEMRLNQEFLDKSVSNADVVFVDFKKSDAASRTILNWASSKTKGGLKIKTNKYAPSTKIALTSAIYFKGKWVYTFGQATPGTFYTPNGPIQSQMMNMKRKFRWGKIGNYAEWAAMPYESGDALVIILPNRDQTVDNVINLMGSRDIDSIMRGIDSESTKANVNITIPKFKLESTTNLVEPLQRMGIRTLFTPNAQLPYLSDYESVQVTNAQQQALMEVNEEGTVFIAFTNLNVVALSFQVPVPDVDFMVDRPFIAMIADTKKNVPFVMAKVTNPA